MKTHDEKDPVTGVFIKFIVTKNAKDMSKKRATAMWRKEKGTIEWLRGMKHDDHLLDIGANVGVYSMFAAVVQGAVVTALEPESLNFARLNQNIRANRMSERITAYPFAASDLSHTGILKVGRMTLGHSGHQVTRRTMTKPEHLQGTWMTKIDDMFLKPTHIKIDVDGDEPRIIEGMSDTLANVVTREIQVEIDTRNEKHKQIDNTLKLFNFKKYEEETLRTDWMQNWRWRRG